MASMTKDHDYMFELILDPDITILAL